MRRDLKTCRVCVNEKSFCEKLGENQFKSFIIRPRFVDKYIVTRIIIIKTTFLQASEF